MAKCNTNQEIYMDPEYARNPDSENDCKTNRPEPTRPEENPNILIEDTIAEELDIQNPDPDSYDQRG